MNIVKKLGLSFVLLVAAFCAQAVTETVNGITWTYTVSNGEASLKNGYSAAIPTSTAGAITIPSTLGGYPVTSIGNYAFYNCDSLTSVTIPNSVTSIGGRAFYSCDSLTSVTIGDSVTSIGDYAFYNCYSLTSVTIPDSVTSIGEWAFYSCDSLTSVTIGDSVTNIGYKAFYLCNSLTSVTIPDSVTSIEEDAFYGCDSLASVYIADLAAWCKISFGDSTANPLYYADELYLNGELITELTIPEGIVNISPHLFSATNHCYPIGRIESFL